MKDLLVSIRPGNTFGQESQNTERHLPITGMLSDGEQLLAQSVKCTQPSKAIFFDFNVTREGPTKRKSQGVVAVDPCPCPSKAPESEEADGRYAIGQPSRATLKSATMLAELKQQLAALQSSTEAAY